jgi:filamentous hemagglutinin family protein
MRWGLITVVTTAGCAVQLAYANPVGPVVVNGQASFSTRGSLLSITNSPGAIINWQQFSIGTGETTRFLQQSSSSAVLNRVVGADPSRIFGSLQSNGRVFLINPSGIVFGPGSQVDVAGLVASSLNLSNADFIAGRLSFTGDAARGAAVVNEGRITVRDGGRVYLVGTAVDNQGLISAPNGDVVLAAGKSVRVAEDGESAVQVEIVAPADRALNLSALDLGRRGIYAGVVRNGGTVRADSAVRTADGRVVLKARDVTLEAGSSVSAGGADGGRVAIEAQQGSALVAGNVTATGSDGRGGSIAIVGERVALADSARVDASGARAGGTILIGGDLHGAAIQEGGRALANAQYADVAPQAQVRADAQASGDGGRVVVWSDKTTRFHGSISARGGAMSGNGGTVEVSGKETLVFKGKVDTRAPKGTTGTLLLDPLNILIQAGIGNADDADGLTNSFAGSPSGTIGTVLAGDTTPTTLFQSELEGIAATTSISLAATNAITIAPLAGGNLNLAQTAGNAVSFQSGTFSMQSGDTITTAGGALNITTTGGAATIGNLATNGGSVILNLAGASTAEAVSGAGTALTKLGAGMLTLNGASTYTGATTIGAGTLALGAAGVLPSGTTVVINGTGTLDIAGFNQTVGGVQLLAGTIAGSGGTLTSTTPYDLRSGTVSAILGGAVGLNKTTAGTVTLSAANTYTGDTTITGGILAVTVNGALGDVAAGTTVEAGATLDLQNVAYGALEPLILNGGALAATGAGSFASTVTLAADSFVSGTGTLTLSGAVTDGGAGFRLTKNGAGTLATAASNLLADAIRLTVDGGTLNFAGFSDTVAGVQLISGTIAGTGGTLTSTTPYDLQSGAVSAILGGTVGVNKTTNGTVTLSAANTYSGVTTISGGILSVAVLANGGLPSGIGQSSNAAGNLLLDGGTLQYTGPSVSIDRNFTLTAGKTSGIDVVGGTTLTLTGSSAATTGGLQKTGGGTLVLQNTLAHTGNTTVGGGVLALGSSNRLADASQLVVNGGTFDLNGFNETQSAVHLFSGSIVGTGQLTSTSAFDLQAGSASAILTGAVGAIKSGPGTVTLSGINTYTGPTTINGGILSVGFLPNGGIPGNIGQSSSAAGNLVLGGGTLQYTGPTTSTDRNFTLTAATTSGIDVFAAGTNLTLTGSGTGAGSLTKFGAGTLTFQTPHTYTGLTTVAAGTLAYGVADALVGAVTVSGGTLNIGTFSDTVGLVTLVDGSITGTTGVLTGTSYEVQNGSISAILAGGGALTKTTGGTVTLSGVSTYTGTTTVNAGTLRLGASGVINDLSSLVVNAGLFDIGAFNETVAGVLLAGGEITGTTGVLISNSNFDLRSGRVSAIIDGAVGVDKTTNGTVTLTRSNLYTGLTTIADGTLVVTSNNGLGTIGAGTVVEAPGTLDLQNVPYTSLEPLTLHGGTVATTVGTSEFAGPISLTANSTALVSGTQLALSGSISESGGSFGLTKLGSGILVLGGANTYTGTLTVSNGTVALAASDRLHDASKVVVNGGTFDVRTFSDTVAGVQLQSGTITGTGPTGILTSTTPYDFWAGTVSAIIAGGVGVEKNTAGTVLLTRDNTYTGATAVNAGSLVVMAPNALGGTAAGTTVTSGASLVIVNTAVVAEPVTLNGNGVGGAGALVGVGNASLAGPVTLASASRIGVSAAADSLGLNGVIEGPGALELTGAGTVTFGATVGAATALASLTQNAATRLNINGGLVRTAGAQTYNGTVTTNGPTTLRTTANGDVTAAGRFTATAGTLTLDTGTGDATLVNPLNDFGTVAVTSGGDVSLVDANSIALGDANLGTLLARALAGNLTLDGRIAATGAGSSIVLVASGNFINNEGAAALDPGPGRFLVYSTNPALDTRGGLAYDFKQYNATFPATPVAQPAGNGFLYSVAPAVTPVLVGPVTRDYNATTVAPLVAANYTVSGAIDGDTVTLNNPAAGTYDTKDVGTGKLVSVAGLSIAGASNGAATVYGYQLAAATASANVGSITPAPATVTPNNQVKTYGDPFVFAGTEFATSGLQGGETIGSVILASAGAAPAAHVAGSPYAITGSGASGGTFAPANYSITYATGNLTVNRAALTVTANDQVKAYGGSAFVFNGTEFTSGGLKNGETIGSVTLVSVGASPIAPVAGSPYPIVPSAATGGTFTANDYTITYVNGLFTVNVAGIPLTITANNLNKVYGTTLAFAGSEFNASGLQNGETIGSVVLASPGAAAASSPTGGPYAITPSGATGGTFTPGNYTITYVNGQLNVTPAPLTVRADNETRRMGQPNPPFSATYTGFQLGQTPAALTGTLALATAATPNSPPGLYPIVPSGLTSTDYAIVFANGVLTVATVFDPTDLIVALQRLGVWDLSQSTCLSEDIGGASAARKGVGARPPRNCGPSAADSGALEAKKVKKTK